MPKEPGEPKEKTLEGLTVEELGQEIEELADILWGLDVAYNDIQDNPGLSKDEDEKRIEANERDAKNANIELERYLEEYKKRAGVDYWEEKERMKEKMTRMTFESGKEEGESGKNG